MKSWIILAIRYYREQPQPKLEYLYCPPTNITVCLSKGSDRQFINNYKCCDSVTSAIFFPINELLSSKLVLLFIKSQKSGSLKTYFNLR